MPHEQPWLDAESKYIMYQKEHIMNSQKDLESVIREHCPVLSILETDHLPEPRCLGAESTRRLYTQVYGMSNNGYTEYAIISAVRSLFNVEITKEDINGIIWSIDNEARIASMKVLP
jgi:hypothetical protein